MLLCQAIYMWLLVGAGAEPHHRVAPTTSTTALLLPHLIFIDDTVVTRLDERLSFQVHTPSHHGRVLQPSEPWESYAVYAYNQVVAVAPGDHRMYYDCIEGDMTKSPPVQVARRICLAKSTDAGVSWTKPNLGVYELPSAGNTKDNNIIMFDGSLGSVFIDRNPSAPASERFKLVTSVTSAQADWNQTGAIWASPDGIHNWTSLPFEPLHDRDDSQPIAHWDSSLGKYVIVLRRDQPATNKSTNVVRQIGRCETDNISHWQKETGGGPCPIIFGPDNVDPDNCDLYTSAWTPYPSDNNPVAHLFFPSMFAHFNAGGVGPPFRFASDGLLDVRLVVSRDGVHLGYAPSSNARSPFVPLGINECGPTASSPYVAGGWCSPLNGEEATTGFDTSNLYMVAGFLPSADGNWLHLFVAGQPFTHGDSLTMHSFGNNTGIGLLKLRRDGFVSIDARYGFYGNNISKYPSLLTVPVTVPAPCSGADDLFVVVNAVTSVVGWVAVGLVNNSTSDGVPIVGFELSSADKLVGNFIRARASWSQNSTSSLRSLVGQQVAFQVALADASLYSLAMACQST